MSDKYYKAPPDAVFNEVKRAAIELWQTYDDTFGYATEKVSRIKDIRNIRDNTCFIVAMFDHKNQLKLYRSLASPEAKQWMQDIREMQVDQSLEEMYRKEV